MTSVGKTPVSQVGPFHSILVSLPPSLLHALRAHGLDDHAQQRSYPVDGEGPTYYTILWMVF